MANKMLIDATHPEETRVVVVRGNRVEEFDFESANRKQLRGNIYLAKVTRVEPSLQAAFVDYGGNRHGFLAFSEIHPDYYRIPVGDRGPTDDESVGDETETRVVVPEEAGVPLAAALPEPVSVDALPESGEDDASEIEPPELPRSGLESVAPSSPSSDTREQGRAPPLTGLPWDDLAPGTDTAALAPGAMSSQPP